MQPGDVVFCSRNSPYSQLVKFLTKSKYGHVMLAIAPQIVVEAVPLWGVRLASACQYDTFDVFNIYRCQNITDKQIKAICDFALNKIGKSYDYPLLMRIFFRIKDITRLFFNNPNTWICSELVDAAYKAAGIDLLPNQDSAITPEELSKSGLLYKVVES